MERWNEVKGITCCAECAYYDRKRHRCTRGAADEGKATAHFYEDCPLDDVAPVEHGRWEIVETEDGVTGKCSVCNRTTFDPAPTDYCPNCGAKMDLGE